MAKEISKGRHDGVKTHRRNAVINVKNKSIISLNGSEDDDSEGEIDYASLNLPKAMSTEEEDDDIEEEDDDEDEDEDDESDEDRTNWGKDIQNYYEYGSEDDDEDDEDDDDINDRIKEANRITKELYENVQDDDAAIEEYEEKEKHTADITNFFDSLVSDLSQSLKKEAAVTSLPEGFSYWTEDEKQKFIEDEHPEFVALIQELKETSNVASKQILSLLNHPDMFKLCNKDGIDYLDIRNELMLLYVTYLCYYLLLKCHGVSIIDHLVIQRLLEIRMMLEKAKPIESRLQYQINKLVNDVGSSDGAELAPRLEDLEIEKGVGDIYKPPSSLPLLETDSYARHLKKQQRKAGSKKSADGDALEVDDDIKSSRTARLMKKFLERENLEMEAMKRYPMSKQEKKGLCLFTFSNVYRTTAIGATTKINERRLHIGSIWFNYIECGHG
ncbi:Sas10-Utp3-C1D [Babesia duncani]|uniref:Sas10-Utp3-C1D n=1 Tax=Babesia duncani TaxID=323732 RepID=A0AAD9PJU4_9APIC|nr:Sas10-Utp3-C1D [Babesia duncani]